MGICRPLAAVCVIAIAAAPSWAATVEGAAFNRLTKAPVANLVVSLAGRTGRSDASGAFRIEGVPPGNHPLVLTLPEGYFRAHAFRRVQVGERDLKLDIPLAAMGAIRGRVLDPDGRPIDNMRVEVFRVHDHSGHFLRTDAQGRFAEANLGPGLYRLRARPVLEGSVLGRKKENLSAIAGRPAEGERWMWSPTYFPNAVELGNAEAIFVGEGVERAGLDIRLRAAPVFKLSGVVEDNEGKPADGVSLVLESEIGWGPAEMEVRSDAAGVFEFPAVCAGEWRIDAKQTRGKIAWTGAVDISLPARDYDKARIRIDPPFELAGTIEGAPRGDATPIYVRLERLVGPPDDDIGTTAQADQRLRFKAVYPGRYRLLLLNRPRGFYLKAIQLGESDVTGREFDLVPSSPPLRIVFAPNPARATGTVERGDVDVVLISADREHLVEGQDMHFARADAAGRFTVEGLAPGAWHAFAFDTTDNMNTDAIRDLVFGRGGLARSAEVIRLGEGETANLKLRISPWFE